VLRTNLKEIGLDIMTASVNFGIILEINGEDVPIEPAKAITDAKRNGVEYSLPRRVEVGTAAELGAFLETLADGVPPLPSGDNFPSPLNTVYQKMISLNLAVEELNLKVPPSVQADGVTAINPPLPTTFTLGLSATWRDNEKVELITGKLAIKGLYVKLVKT
jgi:hypothetical protein